jgi:hypothetical protein
MDMSWSIIEYNFVYKYSFHILKIMTFIRKWHNLRFCAFVPSNKRMTRSRTPKLKKTENAKDDFLLSNSALTLPIQENKYLSLHFP